ncbi:hypothetical protein ACIBCA_29125 [Kitasatospora sp. NPDC051170]
MPGDVVTLWNTSATTSAATSAAATATVAVVGEAVECYARERSPR